MEKAIILGKSKNFPLKLFIKKFKNSGFDIINKQDLEIDKLKKIISEEPIDLLIIDYIILKDISSILLSSKIGSFISSSVILFDNQKLSNLTLFNDFDGLEYLSENNNPKEIEMRIDRITYKLQKNRIKKIGKYIFNPGESTLTLINKNKKIHMGYLAKSILNELLMSPGETIEKQFLMKKYWNSDDSYTARNLDSVIVKLRKYLKDDKNIKILCDKRKGYRIYVKK